MATTTTQPAQIEATSTANPLVLWHLLSLDAPSVATLWTWFVAHSRGVHLPAVTVLAMFLAVWLLYVADRLLDARVLAQPINSHSNSNSTRRLPSSALQDLEQRHLFHHQHRPRFLVAASFAAAALTFLIPRLNVTAIALFVGEASVLAAWFSILHATRLSRHLPKELALGAFFAAAVYIPTLARLGSCTAVLPAALLFAALCSLNCLFIYRWERSPFIDTAHPSTRAAARYVSPVTAAVALCATAAALLHRASPPVAAAIVLAAVSLLALNRYRTRIPRTALRAAADLALLAPLLVLALTR